MGRPPLYFFLSTTGCMSHLGEDLMGESTGCLCPLPQGSMSAKMKATLGT